MVRTPLTTRALHLYRHSKVTLHWVVFCLLVIAAFVIVMEIR